MTARFRSEHPTGCKTPGDSAASRLVHQARLELDAPLLLGGMPALRWMPAARCAFECTLRHDPPRPLAVHAEQLAMRAHASQLCSKSQAVQEPALALVHFMAILRVSFLPAAGGMTVRAHEKSREQQSERERSHRCRRRIFEGEDGGPRDGRPVYSVGARTERCGDLGLEVLIEAQPQRSTPGVARALPRRTAGDCGRGRGRAVSGRAVSEGE